MKLPLHISNGEKRNGKQQAVHQNFYLKTCFLTFIFILLSFHELLAQQHPDLPAPAANIQTATTGSLVIPMDNSKQNIGSVFNLKSYGLIHSLLLNDIPVKWIIRSGKEKDSVDFSATAERLYPTYLSPAMIDFVASEFLIDSVWANNPSPTTGKTANQVITTFGNNVAVYRLSQNVSVDVRYTLNFRPKLAVFDNGGNDNIHAEILDAAGVSNYITCGAGVFPGIFQCYTFASEPHWAGSFPADTPITNNIKNFVLAGGNFLAECRGILTYENLSNFQANGAIAIKNVSVTNTYHNHDLAYMQFQGSMKANQSGSERNWALTPGSSWVPGFYYGVSHTNIDTIVASGAHLIHPDSMGGNVYYLGGHDYSPFNSLLQINAARLYLNATLVPSGRPSPFSANIGSGTTICAGSSVTLGGAPTGPAGSIYSWMPRSTLNDTALSNPVATPVTSTTYYVTVYKSGCYAQASVNVAVATAMSSVITPTNVSCYGGNDGLLSAAVSGGTAPYSYLWSNGQTGSVATGLSAGIYSVTVTSAIGCMATFTDTVTEPVAPLSDSITTTNVFCYGGNNGNAVVAATGGTAGYTYNWNNGQTSSTAFGLLAGNYTVTTTDSKGCQTVSAVTIAEPPVLSSSTTSTNVTCSGGSNGTASVSVTGGTMGYTYLWSNGETTPVDSGLPAGNYSVTVTDTNGCTTISAIVITEPSMPISSSISQTNLICNGSNNGSASVSVSGGIPAYSYLWSDGQTTDSVTGLMAGNYSVTVTDSNGCTSTTPFTVSEPTPVAASMTSTPATFCNSNGTASAAASGGIPPYSYAWNTGPTTTTITGLSPGIYSVTITDSNNCSTIFVDAVVADPGNVPANAGPDQNYCFGDSIQINASGGVGYFWFPSSGLSDPNISNPMASPSTTTSYIVYVTDTSGCIGGDSVTIVVNPLPVADAGSNLSICLNSIDTLHASGGINYSWTPSTGLNDPGSSDPLVSPASTTKYTVMVTDVNGCIYWDSTTVVVNSIPVASAGSNVSLCLNDTCALTASGGINYTWSPAAGISDPSVSNPLASPDSSTTYTVTVTNGNGCIATDDVTVTINPLPLVSAGTSQMICFNNSCTLNSSGGIIYAWSPSTGLSNPNISNPVASPSTTVSYIVHVTDANGCIGTDSVPVIVNPLPLADAGSSFSICINSTDTLHASGGMNYLWSPAAGLNDPTVSDPVVSALSTTTYTVAVTDINGCISSDSATVQVNAIPLASAGNDVSLCLNDTTTLTASGGTSYSWSPVAGLTDPNISNPLSLPDSTTIYTVNVIDGNGCSSTDVVTVTVNPLPVVSAGTNQIICINNSCTLNASGGINYAWSPSTGLSNANIANPVASPSVTTTYVIYVTDTNGCSRSDSMGVTVNPLPVADAGANLSICLNSFATLQASGGMSYAWTPVDGLNNPNSREPITSPAFTTLYTVTVTDGNGCTSTDSATVLVNSIPIANAGNDLSLCLNDTSTLNASGGMNYSWSPAVGLSNSNISNPVVSPFSSTIFTVSVSDSNGCSTTDDVTVIVNPLPAASAGANHALCENNSCTLNASGGINYAWSPSIGLSDTNSSNPTASPGSSITYTVTVTDANGCIDSASTSVSINPLPVISVNSSTICMGSNATLTASGGTQYVWNNGLSTTSIVVSPIATTNYQVIVTDVNGCQDTGLASVTVNPIPSAYAGRDTSILAGNPVQLHATVSGSSYIWSSETNMDCSICLNPVVRPLQTETYIIYTTDAYGCYNRDTVSVIVDDCLVLYIPNAFTPSNHDQVNDNFYARGTCIDKFEFFIYDRWGMQIFESNDMNKGWDGTYMGQPVQQDVYVWVAKARSVAGLNINKTGRVTVMK